MASGERRLGSGRRGMTVLGKIPTPSVPKPINLPSQRLENKGLEPDVELVPRGTFSWGSSGRSNAGSVGQSGTSGATSIPQKASGAWNDAVKPQALPALGNDGESSLGSSRPSSTGSNTRPSSAPTTATNRAWSSMLKSPAEAEVQSIGFVVNSVEPSHLGSKENGDGLLQENKTFSHRPTSADGVVLDKNNHNQSGTHAKAWPGVGPSSGLVSEGFHHPGDGYNRPLLWQGMIPGNGQPAPYAGPFPPEVYYRPFGAPPPPAPPHFSSMRDRDMVMVRMANSPGLYGSYPPPLRPGEYFGQPGVYPPHFEQLIVSGNGHSGSCHPGMSTFFPDSGYPSSHRDGSNIQNFPLGPIYGNERNHRMPKYPGRQKSASVEGFDHGKEPSVGLPMAPERKITLLTKAPQVEVSSAALDGSVMTQVSNEGSDASGQAIHSLSSNNRMSEPSESKNMDMSEVERSSRGHSPAEILGGSGSVVSQSPNKVESMTGHTTLSSRYTESKVDINNLPKSDADSHGVKSRKQACKVPSGSIESFEDSCVTEPTKHLAGVEDIPLRGEHKAKTKAQSLRSEKEWRAKSPAMETKPANEGESCDVSSTSAGNSDVLQDPSLLPNLKVGKHGAHNAIAIVNLPLSASSDRNPNSKAHDLPDPLSNGRPSLVEPAMSVSSTIYTDHGKKFLKEASSDGLGSGGIQVVTIDNTKTSAAEALPPRVDHKAKSRPSNLKAEKEWRPKSPAVDISADSDSIMGSPTTESNVASASDVSSSHDVKIAEQGGIGPLETYDYEGQRAKMKEIAAQRATQRRKEEEERVKERKAKAMAKLEELNRRTLANSTSTELIESGSVLPVNEGPNKKLKRKPDSSQRSAMDASLPDTGILEKQLVHGVMALSTGPANKKAGKVGEDACQQLSDASQTSRNMREESCKDSLRVTEKQRGYRKLASITHDNYQEKEPVTVDLGMHEEPLPLVHDINQESSFTKNHGVHRKVSEGMRQGRRNGTGDHSNKASSTMENEEISVPSIMDEHQVLVASQAGNTRNRRGSSKGGPSMLLHQTSIEGQTKAGKGTVPEKHLINTDQALGQKHSRRRKTSVGIEQVEIEGKQSIDGISASDVGFGPDKPGRPCVSWRQKMSNENHISVSQESAAYDARESQSTSDKPPTQPCNPCKVKIDGRHGNGAPAVKHWQVETRERSEECETETITELQRPNPVCEMIPEAVSQKSERARAGPSHNGWRPKPNHSFANESHSKTPEYTQEGMLDSSQPSNPLIVKDNAQYSSTKGSRTPSGYRNAPTMVPSAHGQVGNKVIAEDDRIGHVRNRYRHKGESMTGSQQKKQESLSHTEPTLPLDGNTQIFKQQVPATKTTEYPFDHQGTRSSSKRAARNENHKHAGQLHGASRRDQLHEPRGQHLPRGHDRHSRHS